MEEETQKIKTLDCSDFVEISLNFEAPPSQTMVIENLTQDFPLSHYILSDSSSTETLVESKENEILPKVENPVVETMVIENLGSDFPKSAQTPDEFTKTEEIGKVDKSLDESEKEGGEKLEDSQMDETLVELVKEGVEKSEDCNINETLVESVKEGGETSKTGDSGEEAEDNGLNKIVLGMEGSEDGLLLDDLKNGMDVEEEDDLGVGHNPWNGFGLMNGCRCLREKEEDWYRRRYHGMGGWPMDGSFRYVEEEEIHQRRNCGLGLQMDGPFNHDEEEEDLCRRKYIKRRPMYGPFYPGDPHNHQNQCCPEGRHMGCMHRDHRNKRYCKRRGPCCAREREAEFYGPQRHNYMGRDSDGFGYQSLGWSEPEPEPTPVGAGLANLGNTCFLNAILQCVTHTVSFVQGLLSLKHEASSHGADEFCVLCAVRDQIEHSLGFSGGVISPSNLVDNLSQISSFFRRYQQEDAHEFLQCLLDKLDSNWSKYEASAIDSSAPDYSTLPGDTLVRQIFGGCLVSQVRCCKCGHNSDTYEPLIDLSLEIEDVDSLESALNSFTKVESIEDTEKFICDSCKEQVKVQKQLMLDQAPFVAALHLKRFKSDGVLVEKIDKKVEFPLELDLAPYTKGSNNGKEDLKYELFGVVVHVGFSSTSGHYFCYIRTDPEKWYRFDDSKVTMVNEESALCQDAYILFYTRKGTPWFGSLIEKWKAESRQKISSTSPKSVLDDMDLPSTSQPVGTGVHGFEAGGKEDATEDTSTASANEIKRDEVQASVGTGFHDCEADGKRDATGDTSISPGAELLLDDVQTNVVVAQDSAVVNQTSAFSSSEPINVKEDKFELDVQLLMEENDASEDETSSKKIRKIVQTSGGTCTSSHVENFSGCEPKNDVESLSGGEPKNDVDIKPSTPPRDLSPDIYSDKEPAEEAYKIPLDHLKIEHKSSSAKKSINADIQDMKRKEAIKYIRKSMPMGKRQMFLAALNARNDSSLSKKRKGQASLFHDKHSPKKRVKISPKRVLRPVTA